MRFPAFEGPTMEFLVLGHDSIARADGPELFGEIDDRQPQLDLCLSLV